MRLVCWLAPLIPALEKQAYLYEFKVSLGYIVRPFVKKGKPQTNKNMSKDLSKNHFLSFVLFS